MKILIHRVFASLLVGLIAVFTLGCGNSNNGDFVATNSSVANTGNLNFQFLQARSVTVPPNTTELLFEFFNDEDVSVFTVSLPFAVSVTVTDIPIESDRVEITALQNGFPVSDITDTVTVVPGQTADVDLTNAPVETITYDSLTVSPNPTNLSKGESQTLSVLANFSDGSSVSVPNSASTFVSRDESLIDTSAEGVLTGVGDGGSTMVDVSWTFNNITKTNTVDATVASLRFEFFLETISAGEMADIDIIFRDTQGNDQNAEDLVEYTIVPSVDDVSVIGDDLTIGIDVPDQTTFAVQSTYTDPTTGVTHSVTTQTITVVDED